MDLILKPFSGNIHTVSVTAPVIYITESNCVNTQKITSSIFTIQKGEKIRHFRFNPNKLYLSEQIKTDRTIECQSLSDFECRYEECMVAECVADRNRMVRLDFKFDYYDTTTVDLWVKFCNLLIGAFIVRHKVTPKNQYLCTTITGDQHKSSKAIWGKFEFENYNKAIQQESNGTSYRFELRFINQKGVVTRDALLSLIYELEGLSAYYGQALELWNNALCTEWDEIKHSGGTQVSPQAFVRIGEKRFFARKQLKQFFDRAYPEIVPTWAVKNYCQKNHPLFISHVLFDKCIKSLCNSIVAYIDGVPQHSFLDDFSSFKF